MVDPIVKNKPPGQNTINVETGTSGFNGHTVIGTLKYSFFKIDIFVSALDKLPCATDTFLTIRSQVGCSKYERTMGAYIRWETLANGKSN